MIAASQPKQLFFNDVQSRVLQIMPKTLICEWGRIGKGVVEAGRILYAVQHMPGCCLGMVPIRQAMSDQYPAICPGTPGGVGIQARRSLHRWQKAVEGAALAGSALPAYELGEHRSLLQW